MQAHVISPVIELTDVHKGFSTGKNKIRALCGVTAKVESGRITGLVGPDGAGKTTLMRILTGLLAPDLGSVRVLNFDGATQATRIQANVGYMPQRFGLYEDLSVIENLKLFADLQGLTASDRKVRFERLLAFSGLQPFRKRLAGRLSGGMKQKLGLACTLVRPPRLLLLDEPSVGVDPVSRRELWQMVCSLVDEGISVLWATAYLDEAERCHDVVLMNEGRLLAHAAPDILSEPLRGRTFLLRTESHARRAVLHQIRGLPGVTDAVIKGRDIRVLVSEHAEPGSLMDYCRQLGLANIEVHPVGPDFEDAFISLLKQQDTSVRQQSSLRRKPPGIGAARNINGGPGQTNDHEAVIAVDGLVRKFGKFTAVDNLQLEVARGEIFGLLGPNGAGKSTTFKILCGLLPPTGGSALVLGIDLRRAAAKARSRIGYMAQQFSLYGNLSVLQNLEFYASAYGLAGRIRRRKVDEEMAEFDLGPYADTISDTLPLGFKRRLALACAIMHAPGVLFLDEPTSGVDPVVRREFWSRINDMAAAGMTIMVTTHFMEEAEYCDRIGIIYRGRLVASGTPDDIREKRRGEDLPNPTLEDAFVDLIERYDRAHPQ